MLTISFCLPSVVASDVTQPLKTPLYAHERVSVKEANCILVLLLKWFWTMDYLKGVRGLPGVPRPTLGTSRLERRPMAAPSCRRRWELWFLRWAPVTKVGVLLLRKKGRVDIKGYLGVSNSYYIGVRCTQQVDNHQNVGFCSCRERWAFCFNCILQKYL